MVPSGKLNVWCNPCRMVVLALKAGTVACPVCESTDTEIIADDRIVQDAKTGTFTILASSPAG